MGLLPVTERKSGCILRWSPIVVLFPLFSFLNIPEASSAAEAKAGILLVEDSVTVTPNNSSLKIPFRVRNDADTLAGFEIVIVLSNPDLVVVDTLNPLDLSGSVLTGWGILGINLFDGTAYKIVGVYNPVPFGPLPPDNSLREIFKLNFLWRELMPDTICSAGVDGIVTQAQTHFSDRTGTLIAYTWVAGGIYVTCFPCGDADGNSIVTISDVVYLINYIFAGGPPPIFDQGADVDCSGIITISDVVYIVNFIFAGGPVPCSVCLY